MLSSVIYIYNLLKAKGTVISLFCLQKPKQFKVRLQHVHRLLLKGPTLWVFCWCEVKGIKLGSSLLPNTSFCHKPPVEA